MLFSVFILALLLTSLIGARNVISAHLQGITYLLTGKKRLGLILYSIIFLPGVIIHEISHFFMAAFLGVRTGDITIFPSGQTEEGDERLGSVKIAKTDFLRGSLIGIAPLIFGSFIIIALSKWQFPELLISLSEFNQPLNQLVIEGNRILSQPLNLIWIYLIFAISNTMFVSRSDRKSWPALIVVFTLFVIVSIFVGVTSPIAQAVRTPILTGINVLTAAFLISLVIDVIIFAPLLLVEKVIEKLTKKHISYKNPIA